MTMLVGGCRQTVSLVVIWGVSQHMGYASDIELPTEFYKVSKGLFLSLWQFGLDFSTFYRAKLSNLSLRRVITLACR